MGRLCRSLQPILSQTSQAVLYADSERRIRYKSPNSATIFGFDPEDVYAFHSIDEFPGIEIMAHSRTMWELVRTGRILDINRKALEDYGAEAKEEIFESMDNIQTEESIDSLLRIIQAVLRQKGASKLHQSTGI